MRDFLVCKIISQDMLYMKFIRETIVNVTDPQSHMKCEFFLCPQRLFVQFVSKNYKIIKFCFVFFLVIIEFFLDTISTPEKKLFPFHDTPKMKWIRKLHKYKKRVESRAPNSNQMVFLLLESEEDGRGNERILICPKFNVIFFFVFSILFRPCVSFLVFFL